MKFLVLSSIDTPLACTDDSIVHGVRDVLMKSPGARQAESADDADAIILHEKFCFKEWRYISKLIEDPIVGRYPHKVYTINRDDAAHGLLKGIYTSMLKCHQTRGLHRAVHYAYWPNKGILRAGDTPRPTPKFLAAWSGNTKSNPTLRGRMVELCGSDPDYFIEATDSWMNHQPDEQQRFVDSMRDSKYALCPAGWSAASFRVYESMAVGVCPVIIADDFIAPSGPDWSKCAIQVRERDLPQLKKILTRYEPDWAERGQQARQAWLRYFSPKASLDYYANELLLCIEPNRGLGSRDQEIARWRSFRTRWNNEWTIPQRLRAMLRKQIQSGRRKVAKLMPEKLLTRSRPRKTSGPGSAIR